MPRPRWHPGEVKQPTYFSALLLARYIHCCSYCPRQLRVALATTITVIGRCCRHRHRRRHFCRHRCCRCCCRIIVAVRFTAASSFQRCRCVHHLRVVVVASSSPLLPSLPFYRCRVIVTFPVCGVAVTFFASFPLSPSPSPSPPCHRFRRCSAVPLSRHLCRRCHRCWHHRHHHMRHRYCHHRHHHRFIVVANVATASSRRCCIVDVAVTVAVVTAH